MTKKINTIKTMADLRDVLTDALIKMRDKKADRKDMEVIANLGGKIINSCSTEAKICHLAGVKPNMAFIPQTVQAGE